MTFRPATPANAMVRAVMESCDCNDWLEIGEIFRFGDAAEFWRACELDAEEYLQSWGGGYSECDRRAVAEYMRGQCVAYAYALDMGAA